MGGSGRVLLGVLVAACAPTGPLLFGIDETLEHRRGERIATNDHLTLPEGADRLGQYCSTRRQSHKDE